MIVERIRYGFVTLLLSLLMVDFACAVDEPIGDENLSDKNLTDRAVAEGAMADGAVALLPDDMLGFLWIRSMADVDVKASAWMQQFGISFPSPLEFLQIATRFDQGVDDQRDFLLALLPLKADSKEYIPVVLLPVTDYEVLAASVRADESGEICRVTISGEDVLMAHNRGHAMLMNIEHRATMERLLVRAPRLLKSVRPLKSWLADNDMAIVLSPKGMENLFAAGKHGVERSERNFEQSIEQVPMKELVDQVRQTFAIYHVLLKIADAQVESSALGVSIDEHTNVRVGMRLTLTETNPFSQFQFVPIEQSQSGLFENKSQEGADVATLMGTIPPGWGNLLAKMSRRLLEQFPELEGYDQFKLADWNKVEQSYQALLAGVQTVSMVMRVVPDDEPLLSGLCGVVQVNDANAYLASYQHALKLNNELVERSRSDIKLLREFSPVTVAGATGIKVVSDIAAASGDQNNPFWQETLSKLLGEEGKLIFHLLAIDQTHMVVSTAGDKNLSRYIREFRTAGQQNISEQIDGSSLSTTMELLEKSSPWILTISPHGTVQWIGRWLEALMGPIGQPHPFPPFPATPPIGISLNLVEGLCKVDLVLPAKTLSGLAEFIQETR
jgi:hypothetical protein